MGIGYLPALQTGFGMLDGRVNQSRLMASQDIDAIIGLNRDRVIQVLPCRHEVTGALLEFGPDKQFVDKRICSSDTTGTLQTT